MTKRKYTRRIQIVEVEQAVATYEAKGDHAASAALRSFFRADSLNEDNILAHRKSVEDFMGGRGVTA